MWNSAAVAAAVVNGVLGAVAAADVDPFDFDGDPCLLYTSPSPRD